MAVDFQDEDKSGTEKVARNPNNFNILKGGKVDPRSKLYQRSLEGREKLSDYLNRLWNDGGDEADVFMAGVKSLMNRGHGYVGAYLDSKNPGRRYTDNQAKAIVDQVMTDEGIGEHPGARLTRPKAEDDSPEAKEKAKQAKASRKEANVARGSGPQQAPGRKAMPVGQQRKLGKRESTGQALEDSQRPGREGGAEGSRAVKEDASKYRQPVRTGTGETEFYNVDKVRGVLEDWKKGEASTEDVLAEFQKTYQKPLSDSPQADAERRQKRAESRDRYYTTGSGKMPDEEKQERPGAQGSARPSGAQPSSALEEVGAPEEEGGKVNVSNEIREALIVPSLRTLFGGRSKENSPGKELENYINDIASGWEGDSNILNSMFDDLSNEISKTYKEQTGVNLDTSSVKNSILETIKRSKGAASKFGTSLEGVQSSPETPTPSEQPQPRQAAPEEAKQPPLDRQAQATDEDVMRRATLLGGKKPPEEQAPPKRGSKINRGFESLVPKQPASRGGGGITVSSKPSPEQIKAIKEKVAKVPKEQLIKEMEQGTLFPSGLVTETSQTNPLEGGSTSTGVPDTEQPVNEKTPEETGDSLLDEEGAAKDFRKSGPEKPKPAAEKTTQRSIRGLGPSSGKFDTTRTQKSGDELLTQDLKSYGFTPKQVKEIQKSGLTEKERQTITQRRLNTQKEKAKQAPKVVEERGGSLLDGENEAKDFRKSGPQAPAKPKGGKRTKGPLNQIAKTILAGLERDKSARENLLNRVSELVRQQGGKNVSKSDADQAAANAINQQKGRTTRNKTTNNAEYQEFAQSIRSMMR